MEYAVLNSGNFVSTGASYTIELNPEIDMLTVLNYTVAFNNTADYGVKYYWGPGIDQNDAIAWVNNAGGTATLMTTCSGLTVPGISIVNSTLTTPGASVALTAISAANPPVVLTATPPSLGSIVRFSNLDNQPQIGGIDFTVSAVVPGTSFTIGNINLVNSTASTTGKWRLIPYDPIYYPRARTITYISSEAQAKVYMSVTHGYTVGQSIRLSFPGGTSQWGQWAQFEGVQALIVAVNVARAGNEPTNAVKDNNIVINLNTSAVVVWDTFGNNPNNNLGNQRYVSANQVPYSPAQVIPVGEGVNSNIVTVPQFSANLLDDATVNTGFTGAILAAGITSPAGSIGDTILWWAGQSFSTNNQIQTP